MCSMVLFLLSARVCERTQVVCLRCVCSLLLLFEHTVSNDRCDMFLSLRLRVVFLCACVCFLHPGAQARSTQAAGKKMARVLALR